MSRFFRSELGMVFRRRRNQVLLAVLALLPILIGISVRLQDGRQDGVFGGLTDNGLFAALTALLVAGPVFLPLLAAVVGGDAIAGEASTGTLRYLLAVPVGRTRLLAAKLGAVLAWCVACSLVVSVVGVLTGLVLFPNGSLTLLSGRTVSYGEGLLRLLAAGGYVAAGAFVVGTIGLFVSTMTEVPLAAMAGTLVLVVASEVADAVPDLSSIHGWLPTHYLRAWVDLLRSPVVTTNIGTGLLVELAYVALFASLAWARFGGKDVTS